MSPAEIVGELRLHSICAALASAVRDDMFALTLVPDTLKAELAFETTLRSPPGEIPGFVLFLVEFKATATSNQAPAATAVAAYRVLYEKNSAALELDQRDIDFIGQELALHHVWPSARERLQSLLHGIGIVGPPLPLRRLAPVLADRSPAPKDG